MSNPFQNIGRNAACLLAVAIASVVVVKSTVRNKKEARYSTSATANSSAENSGGYYDNIAQVRPGFPLPQNQNSEHQERKSVYEGPGMSRASRKKGDKLGFFDRWWG
ncbi:uncharacterized protein ZBIST_1623 [Zygosaccharomyces bailii]|nr:uncharacterized protein ZBIST_1623 [Zygosaccharomyces bailii]